MTDLFENRNLLGFDDSFDVLFWPRAPAQLVWPLPPKTFLGSARYLVPVDEKDEPRFYKGFCKVWRKPGYWNIVNSKYTHRVELDDASPKPWTLFIPLIHNNYWGFWVKNNMNVWSKINHEVYLENKDKSSRENIKTEQ